MKFGQAISFFVPGKPRGKGRPRFGMGRVFTDAKTVEYEKRIALCALAAGVSRIERERGVAIQVLIHQPNPMAKPDCDNVVKCVLDSLGGKRATKKRRAVPGIAFQDDSQVLVLITKKLKPSVLGIGVTVMLQEAWP